MTGFEPAASCSQSRLSGHKCLSFLPLYAFFFANSSYTVDAYWQHTGDIQQTGIRLT